MDNKDDPITNCDFLSDKAGNRIGCRLTRKSGLIEEVWSPFPTKKKGGPGRESIRRAQLKLRGFYRTDKHGLAELCAIEELLRQALPRAVESFKPDLTQLAEMIIVRFLRTSKDNFERVAQEFRDELRVQQPAAKKKLEALLGRELNVTEDADDNWRRYIWLMAAAIEPIFAESEKSATTIRALSKRVEELERQAQQKSAAERAGIATKLFSKLRGVTSKEPGE